MSLRALLIDQSETYCRLLTHHIMVGWPDASVSTSMALDPQVLPAHISRANQDVILLGCELAAASPGEEHDGLDVLRAIMDSDDPPPVIVLAHHGNELFAVEALRAGAADYIPKSELKNDRLVASINRAVRGEPQTRGNRKSLRPLSESGRQIGIEGYRVIRSLAVTGQSAVYLAHSKALDKNVALKVLLRARDDERELLRLRRFEREYEIILKLPRRFVGDIYEYGFTDDHLYVAMEFFPGGDLRAQLKRWKRLSPQYSAFYLRHIAQSLKVLHDNGVLHRDLKPANVMLRENDTPVLIDFGMAVHAQSNVLTGAGEIRGTPYYMSPEQAQGHRIDQRSDLYSLGIMLFEMLTGRKPYTGDLPMEVLHQQVEAPLPRVPEPLAEYQPVLDRLLAKSPSDRFFNAAALLSALEAASGSAASLG